MADAQQPTRLAIHVQVTRANGDVEDHGIVSFHSIHEAENALFEFRQALGHRIHHHEVFTPHFVTGEPAPAKATDQTAGGQA